MLRKTLRWTGIFLLLTVIVPIAIGGAVGYARGWPDSWRKAKWTSSGVLPAAVATPDAKVVILATRTGRWKSIFAEHMSLVLKREGAPAWTRYDVVGWGNPVRRDAYAADAMWYGNTPYIAAEISGDEAQQLIPAIEKAIASYPHQGRGSYTVWPGPNSNTFVAWVVRHTPGFSVDLPPAAVGKDYLGPGLAAGPAASGTGVMVSAWGLIGLTLGLREGAELNLLGATIGIDPDDAAIKLPALGKLSLWDLVG